MWAMAYKQFLKQVADNIKKTRQACDLTQEGMAKHGFNIRHYQDIEAAKVSITLETLYRIAKAFQVDPIKLIK